MISKVWNLIKSCSLFQYTRLYGKYEQALEKIKELRQLTTSDDEQAHKEYLDELANIKVSSSITFCLLKYPERYVAEGAILTFSLLLFTEHFSLKKQGVIKIFRVLQRLCPVWKILRPTNSTFCSQHNNKLDRSYFLENEKRLRATKSWSVFGCFTIPDHTECFE